MTPESEQQTKLTLELRRGLLIMAVLEALAVPHYGYSLRRFLSDKGLEVDEGTLYPLLRRLETQGLLSSEWEVQEGRKRRVYRRSSAGTAARQSMFEEWQLLNQALHRISESTP